MVAPFDYDALWMKAKLFISRAIEDKGDRSPDEQSLWATLALELLAKAALSRVSPLLIAESTSDGMHLLIASGLVEDGSRFKSARASTLFAMCAKAFKPFNQTEAIRMIDARNEYLHGAGVGFSVIPRSAWWPRYWSLATVLIAALDKDIVDFAGEDKRGLVMRILSRIQNLLSIEQKRSYQGPGNVTISIGRALFRQGWQLNGTRMLIGVADAASMLRENVRHAAQMPASRGNPPILIILNLTMMITRRTWRATR